MPATLRDEVIAMRQRMRAELDRSDAARFDLKQGEGGLVDLEFLLQWLVLDRADADARWLAAARYAGAVARGVRRTPWWIARRAMRCSRRMRRCWRRA